MHFDYAIFAILNMIAGISGSPDGAVLIRPQPWPVEDTDITVFILSPLFNGKIACDTSTMVSFVEITEARVLLFDTSLSFCKPQINITICIT